MRLKPLLAPLLLFLLTTQNACNKSTSSSEEVIRIGEVGTMTGTEASFGVGTHRGIELAIREINAAGGIRGRKLELVSLDDQGKPEETTSAATQLITRYKVVALVGGLPSSRTMAMAPIAQKYSTLLVSPSGTNPRVTQFGDYIFRVCFIDPFQGHVMAKFALESLKFKRIAIMRDVKSDYSVGLSEFFTDTLKKAGGEIVAEQSYSSGDIDFKSQLTAIRAKKPEAVFIPGYYTEAALIARQARELGMTLPLLGGDGFDSPKYVEIGGKSVNDSYYSTHYSSDNQSPLVQNFISQFKKQYGMIPDGLSTLGYDAIMVLADAIKRSASFSNSDIREALANTRNFSGVTGTITLDKNRNPVKSAVILKIEEGQIKYNSSVNP